MSEFFTLRARRFDALHDLLTGRLREHAQALPTYPAEDLGPPTAAPQTNSVGPLGTFIRGAGQ